MKLVQECVNMIVIKDKMINEKEKASVHRVLHVDVAQLHFAHLMCLSRLLRIAI